MFLFHTQRLLQCVVLAVIISVVAVREPKVVQGANELDVLRSEPHKFDVHDFDLQSQLLREVATKGIGVGSISLSPDDVNVVRGEDALDVGKCLLKQVQLLWTIVELTVGICNAHLVPEYLGLRVELSFPAPDGINDFLQRRNSISHIAVIVIRIR